ncbi:hypothetical protein [Mesorhizobium sp. M2A.F.Ca.ET.067.02.1.1]|uniref:hypothetical protein n=1 Tax=Mesorhizobium sp. M2A.F.Ca.ET.067.02.1.1 TaxID=2496749 RepID=UPI0016775C0B|nr:hypothetical protein [Mesorhizobium sp. M2A.F.Ca.ET.067.02.1.1]
MNKALKRKIRFERALAVDDVVGGDRDPARGLIAAHILCFKRGCNESFSSSWWMGLTTLYPADRRPSLPFRFLGLTMKITQQDSGCSTNIEHDAL